MELLDYRPNSRHDPPPKEPGRTRTVLHPSPETLWADICLMNQKQGGKWSDQDALKIEAQILVCTSIIPNNSLR